jgi:hypothetical protein
MISVNEIAKDLQTCHQGQWGATKCYIQYMYIYPLCTYKGVITDWLSFYEPDMWTAGKNVLRANVDYQYWPVVNIFYNRLRELRGHI